MNTMKLDPARCSETGCFGEYHVRQCSKKAVVQENGRGWCKVHSPSHIKAVEEARTARWKRDDEVREAHRTIQKAKHAVVTAAEAYVAMACIGNPDDVQLREAVRLLGVAEAKAKELGIVLT
jgi:hypothetical protein